MSAAGVTPEPATAFRLRTVVVEGPLALRMRRLQAARAGELGLQIVSLPQLAARLVGGFARPAVADDLEPAARTALAEGGFADIGALSGLPGMVRALVRTLERLWRAGVDPAALHSHHPRLGDVARLDARVRQALGGGALAPPDLVALALARLDLAPQLLGDVALEHLCHVAPVWRPLLEGLSERVEVTWLGSPPPAGWAAGAALDDPGPSEGSVEIVACAHPQAEVIEALRCVRELLATGRARPEEIALAATSPGPWDDTMLGLVAGSGLPIYFSHGVPALTTVEGQACAALAELLAQGLSQDRVRRVLSHGAGRCPALMDLPEAPLAGVSSAASLATLEQWRTALAAARGARFDGADVGACLLPVLELAAQGLPAAEQAGDRLLPRGAAKLWTAALRGAPAAALPFTLSTLRAPDGGDPASSVVWAPASHLAGAPRPWVRLLGMTSRSWPRPRRDDPLLPEHILALEPAVSPSRPETDRALFAAIQRGAGSHLVLSYARRSPQGGLQAPSPLLPRGVVHRRLGRMRIPEHAFSESDRLQARPEDAAGEPSLARPVSCARARRGGDLTPFDGPVRADHPVVLQALAEVQSATSLRWLIRDPQVFVWRYALGWRETLEDAGALTLDDRAFGDLVHELLQHTVVELESGPGFGRAGEAETAAALGGAAASVAARWPALRATPPPLLWRHTVEKAREMAWLALRLDKPFEAGTRSWTEAPFGDPRAAGQPAPWDPVADVPVPGTDLRIRGRIDRLEVAAGEGAARITDYKTGAAPANADSLVLAGGAELQRVLYTVAVRRHLPDARIVSDLVYLADANPTRCRLKDSEAAITAAAAMLNLAADLVRRGVSLPGPDSRERWNPYRLARPASGDPQLKDHAVEDALGAFRRVWTTP